VTDTRRNGPPPIESIIKDAAGRQDVGYTLRVHLQGLRGTWHRLWAMIGTAEIFGDTDDMAEGVSALRGQFEQELGRPMTSIEWQQLVDDARAHGKRLAGNT
jgi:hypothetical protein